MHIYLSPHHDDVCFSLGHLARRQGGHVVNIFTRSAYTARGAETRIDAVTALRLAEDQAFIQAAGLSRHDLFLEEPSLIGHAPFDLTNLKAAVARTTERLLPFLLDLLPATGDPRDVHLYCPAGIGGHRDHVSTLLAVAHAHERLRERCTLHLYEDLHYASRAAARDSGLQEAARAFAGLMLSATAHFMSEADAARKMQLIGLYASQHDRPPAAKDFTPASNLTTAMHEMVWNVTKEH